MKTFSVQLITPDKELFCGEVVSLNVQLEDGKAQILANHMQSVSALALGKCTIQFKSGTTRNFATNEGVLCVKKDKTVVLSTFLEWEEDVETALEKRKAHIEDEKARRKESYLEYRLSIVALEKMFANLKNTNI